MEQNIIFEINLNVLIESVLNCNLGIGDLANPIDASSFITNSGPEIPEYFLGETIVLTVSEEPVSMIAIKNHLSYTGNIAIVCSTIENVTKNSDYNSARTIQLMNDIFAIDTTTRSSSNVQQNSLLTNGAISLAPSDMTSCKLDIQSKINGECTIYIRYNVLFTVQSDSFTNENKTYYFTIDPLLKISSKNRP